MKNCRRPLPGKWRNKEDSSKALWPTVDCSRGGRGTSGGSQHSATKSQHSATKSQHSATKSQHSATRIGDV